MNTWYHVITSGVVIIFHVDFESIYAAATAVNDHRILTLCENYHFLAAEARCHKECYAQYMKQAKENEGSKTKEGVQKPQYEIAEGETITCLMKYMRK